MHFSITSESFPPNLLQGAVIMHDELLFQLQLNRFYFALR